LNKTNIFKKIAEIGFDELNNNFLLIELDTDCLQFVIKLLTTQFEIGSTIYSMKKSSERILEITSSLKRFSHLDRAVEGDIDIIQGIEDTLVILRNEFKNGINVIRNYEKIPKISGYPAELTQVWTNIMMNAGQAMGGEGTLKIHTKYRNNKIEIKFIDSGHGIDENIIEKIFDPFFSTKDQGQGTGLGLSISYGIIKKHKGEITASSFPGETIFTITLPVN